MEAIHEAPAAPSSTDEATATGSNVTSPAPKEALTQWIVDTLVSEVVSDITADGLMTRVLQSDAAAERVEVLTGQLKQKLRAHIEQQALDELEAEFAGDLEVLNRWPEAQGTLPESSSESPADSSAAAQAEETLLEPLTPDAPVSDTVDDLPEGPEASPEPGIAAKAADASPVDTIHEQKAPEDVAPENVAPEDVGPEDVASEDNTPGSWETVEGSFEDEASDQHEQKKPTEEIVLDPETPGGGPTEHNTGVATDADMLDASDAPDAEDMVEDLVQSFGVFPDDPAEDATATSAASEDATIQDELDEAVFPDTLPDVSLEAADSLPQVLDEGGNSNEATSVGAASDGASSDVSAPEETHEAATMHEEPHSDESQHPEQQAHQTDEHEKEEDAATSAGPLHHDADTPNTGVEDPSATATDEPAADTRPVVDEEPDFSPIDWDAEPDTDTLDTSETERFTASPIAEDAPLSGADDEVALDDAFFDGDFFPDMADDEGETPVDDDATPTADVTTVDPPRPAVATDEILFARALIGGTPDARASLRKTFSHAAYRLVEWPTFDVLVEAVGGREDATNRAGGDTLAKVLQLIPGTIPIIPLRDSHPTQSMAELRAAVDEVDDILHDALQEQSAQEAWHMSVLMDKEDVRRYVVDHHAPVREHLNEMRGKPQGVARFIKKKMVESINEEVDRLADECTEAVAALIKQHGNDVTNVAHTPGRDGDYYHLAQIAGLFDSASDDVLVALTSELVETYGMYGFIFRPEGPSKPRHFSMVFPEADGDA
ncbi:MAG: hypothetical protein GVY12_07595 [Bacteroidetes bacterium]|jgi:hypothetical protein|nr:hypothetical protein [Bacteroidota bacterium]